MRRDNMGYVTGPRLRPWVKLVSVALVVMAILAGLPVTRAGDCRPVGLSRAVVTNVSRIQGQWRWDVSFDAGQRFGHFWTTRRFAVGQRIQVSGCADRFGEILAPRVRR